VTRARRGLATAALLVAVVAPRDAHAADPDPWLGPDKVLHFGASATIAVGGYALGAALFDARGHALILGGALAFGAGIGKECLDLAGYGDPSWRDLTWDAIGTVSGLAIAWSADLVLRGVSEKHPLLVAPQADRAGVGLTVIGTF
jgi:putative lipoprotein